MYFSKFFSIVTLLMVTMSVASAQQFKRNSATVSSDVEMVPEFSRFELGESVMLFKGLPKVHEFGWRASILHAWRMNEAKAPLYFHIGLEMHYNFAFNDEVNSYGETVDSEDKFLSVSIPLNLSENIRLSDHCCMELLTGLNIRINAIGFTQYSNQKVNYMSNGLAHRFLTGVNFGLGFNFGRNCVLYRHTMDCRDYFTSEVTRNGGEQFDGARLRHHSISWGIMF